MKLSEILNQANQLAVCEKLNYDDVILPPADSLDSRKLSIILGKYDNVIILKKMLVY